MPPRPPAGPQPRTQSAPVHHQQPAHHQAPSATPVAPQPVQHLQTTSAQPAQPAQPSPTASPAHHQSHRPPAHQPAATKPKRKKGKVKKFFKTVGVLLFVSLLAAGLFGAYKYGYKPYLDKKNAVAAPMTETVSSDPAVQLANTLGKSFDLPSETPLLVTVQDASKVNSNPFFAKVQSGDQVLYYQNAKVAVLYRPTTKKMINYSPNAVISNIQDATQQ